MASVDDPPGCPPGGIDDFANRSVAESLMPDPRIFSTVLGFAALGVVVGVRLEIAVDIVLQRHINVYLMDCNAIDVGSVLAFRLFVPERGRVRRSSSNPTYWYPFLMSPCELT